MRLILILLLLAFNCRGQEYSKFLTSLKSSNPKSSIFKYEYEIPNDFYALELSIDAFDVPDAVIIKFGDEVFWSGFIGNDVRHNHKQKELSLSAKENFIYFQKQSIQ